MASLPNTSSNKRFAPSNGPSDEHISAKRVHNAPLFSFDPLPSQAERELSVLLRDLKKVLSIQKAPSRGWEINFYMKQMRENFSRMVNPLYRGVYIYIMKKSFNDDNLKEIVRRYNLSESHLKGVISSYASFIREAYYDFILPKVDCLFLFGSRIDISRSSLDGFNDI